MSKKRRFSMCEAYKGTSSMENGGRKSPIKIEIRKDFYLITASFAFFILNEVLFVIIRTFSVLLNVIAPTTAIVKRCGQTKGNDAIGEILW